MKKSTKGALAAAAAAVLLLGGAGSLAYWNSESNVNGGTFDSGELSLAAPDCDGTNDGTAGTAVWTIDTTDAVVTTSTRIVPGDVLTKVCFIDITAVGDHLGADLDVTTPPTWVTAGSDTELTSKLVPTATFLVGGATAASITEDDDITTDGTGEIEATISIDFPIGTTVDNTTNAPGGLTAILDQVKVTATQTHNAT